MHLRARGTEYRFVPDPFFEAALNNHESNLAQETRDTLYRLALDLRRSPPHEVIPRQESDSTWSARRSEEFFLREGASFEVRKRNELDRIHVFLRASHQVEVLWMLARASDAQLKHLLAGHSLMASVPAREDGTIGLPGTTADYQRLRHLKHAYVVAQLKPSEGEMTIRYYSRGTDVRGMSSGFTILLKGEGVYSFGEPWSPLSEATRRWRANGSPVSGTSAWRTKQRRPFGEWLEGVAESTKRPVVAFASPLLFGGFASDLGAIRENENWLQVWPPLFWRTQKDFTYLNCPIPIYRIPSRPSMPPWPTWKVSTRQFRHAPPYSRLPNSVTPKGNGSNFNLKPNGWLFGVRCLRKRSKRPSAMAFPTPNSHRISGPSLKTHYSHPRSIPFPKVKPSISSRRRCASVRMRLRTERIGLLTDGSSGGNFSLKDAPLIIRLNRDDTPFEALNVTVAFETPRASCQEDFYVLREYKS